MPEVMLDLVDLLPISVPRFQPVRIQQEIAAPVSIIKHDKFSNKYDVLFNFATILFFRIKMTCSLPATFPEFV